MFEVGDVQLIILDIFFLVGENHFMNLLSDGVVNFHAGGTDIVLSIHVQVLLTTFQRFQYFIETLVMNL